MKNIPLLCAGKKSLKVEKLLFTLQTLIIPFYFNKGKYVSMYAYSGYYLIYIIHMFIYILFDTLITIKNAIYSSTFVIGVIQQLRGQNLAAFCPPLPCVYSFYTLSVDKNKHFLTPSPPHIVHVVIECFILGNKDEIQISYIIINV